ncbi:hypothetical protein [Streptomyces sp. ITFR-16]|uniref:hypothetical protein n=1 Tax=Streptomyces sp. ITFR-16 TaxID=3075198 RepID=UPI002889DBAF|nr:hypothetical protein [Streptomyces sp. ITFR-16]WNI23858.1 hypothetical protein RLT58_18915 [Streptomyces sp. ITFR-16]
MKRFVVVEASPFPDVLHARCGDTSLRVLLGPVGRVHGSSVIDEHLVVDVDTCRDGSLLDCADVLQGSRAHSAAGALHRLASLVAAHPACGIAAVPLAGAGGSGGWALADGYDRSVVLVPQDHRPPQAGPAEQSLLPSCVHAWLVAGRSLREWPYAREAPAG